MPLLAGAEAMAERRLRARKLPPPAETATLSWETKTLLMASGQ
jgi:hypothetical protein